MPLTATITPGGWCICATKGDFVTKPVHCGAITTHAVRIYDTARMANAVAECLSRKGGITLIPAVEELRTPTRDKEHSLQQKILARQRRKELKEFRVDMEARVMQKHGFMKRRERWTDIQEFSV